MHEKSILELIKERLDGREIDLPIFDSLAVKLQHILSSENYDVEKVSQIIQQDQTLVAQVLKIANSAFYKGLKQITTVQDAIDYVNKQ